VELENAFILAEEDVVAESIKAYVPFAGKPWLLMCSYYCYCDLLLENAFILANGDAIADSIKHLM
jgi:hypothetical protein